jgi:mannose-6-phosphate isomerase-like protein (cupin superfamily)
MPTINEDIARHATENTDFRREIITNKHTQVVLMSIEPGDDIGEETHDADQTTFFVAGDGQAVIDGHKTKVGPNHLIVIPKGAKHNIINKGDEPLKLYSVYAPPAEEPGVDHKTKADADAAEEE